MAISPRLYAVVSHSSQALIRKRNVIEIRAHKKQELETKKAIDRANEVLDLPQGRPDREFVLDSDRIPSAQARSEQSRDQMRIGAGPGVSHSRRAPAQKLRLVRK